MSGGCEAHGRVAVEVVRLRLDGERVVGDQEALGIEEIKA